MSIFNSLGSNYNLKIVLQALLSRNEATNYHRLKSYLEDKYKGQTILLYKGREALELALTILNFQDAYVAINGYTCYAVYQAVIAAKYNIEYIDIAEFDLNFSPEALEATLQRNPFIKVVVIQNTLGYPCDIQKIAAICKRANIILIEDLAHSIGTTYEDGSEAGTRGDFVILSFSQDKMIDGISGGALIIRNEHYQPIHNITFDKVNPGQQWKDRWYPFFTFIIRKTYGIGIGKIIHSLLRKAGLLSTPMGNASPQAFHELPPWYCGLIYTQFQTLGKDLEHRKTIANMYAEHVDAQYLKLNSTNHMSHSTNVRFPVCMKNRGALIRYLRKYRIFISDIWYDAPIAPKNYMCLVDYHHQCKRSEKTADEMLNLPTHKNISIEQANMLAQRIQVWLQSQQKQ